MFYLAGTLPCSSDLSRMKDKQPAACSMYRQSEVFLFKATRAWVISGSEAFPKFDHFGYLYFCFSLGCVRLDSDRRRHALIELVI